MLKSILAIILLSVAAVFFKNQLVLGLHALFYLHAQVAHWLAMVFSQDYVGKILQWTLGLVLVPIVIGTLVGLFMLAVKREHVKVGIASVWVAWTILLVGVLVQHA